MVGAVTRKVPSHDERAKVFAEVCRSLLPLRDIHIWVGSMLQETGPLIWPYYI